MTKPLAEGILALDFPAADAARADELNAKANEGLLTEDEQAELEAHVNIGDLLAYWHPKLARLAAALTEDLGAAVRRRAGNRCEYCHPRRMLSVVLSTLNTSSPSNTAQKLSLEIWRLLAGTAI